MADSKISELSTGTTPLTGTEQIVAVQSGTTFKFTTQDIADLATSSNIGNSDLTISATGTRKLVMAGALSTDKFSIRNSADTNNIAEFRGDGYVSLFSGTSSEKHGFYNSGQVVHRHSSGYMYFTGSKIELSAVSCVYGTNNSATSSEFSCNQGNAFLRGGTKGIYIYNNGNFHFGASTGLLAGSGNGNIILSNGAAPSTNLADKHYYYSADQAAGNACPHFRTELGDVIKLYKETALTASDGTTLANVITRMDELEARLQNIGILT